jgi:hypothetical protein
MHCFNQLKNTCRQLHSENLGLEVEYNRVSFIGSELKLPTCDFLNSFASCSPGKAENFTDIDTEVSSVGDDAYRMVEPIASLLLIAEFCCDHF